MDDLPLLNIPVTPRVIRYAYTKALAASIHTCGDLGVIFSCVEWDPDPRDHCRASHLMMIEKEFLMLKHNSATLLSTALGMN